MKSEPSKNQYRAVDPISRFRWALSFPGISPAAGKVLAALADHADQSKLTCWPALETLARETQVSERGVRYALRQLEAAGAILTERSRGRTSSVYRLLIPPNPAIPAGFNPAESAPSNPARIAPNPAESAPFNPAESAPKQSYSLEQSKEQSKQQRGRVREPDENQTDTAAAPESFINETAPKIHPADKRHVCPECENTWPKQFGTTCYKCQCDLERAHSPAERLAELDAEEAEDSCFEEATPPAKPPISQTTWRLLGAMGGQLPESWLNHQNLKQLIAERDFEEVRDIIVGIGSNKLPEPAPFFEAYDQHLKEHKRGEAELKALFLTPQQANNGTNGANGTRRAA